MRSSCQVTHEGWKVLIVVCYLPLLLWAPLLAAVTYSYHWRHQGAQR